jgi:colicin import membrane protein
VSLSDTDIQLQVWKDLAISKQILMGAATSALGLSYECSTAELKEALNQAIQRAKDADISILATREKTDLEVADMAQQVADSNKAREAAEAQIAVAENARETAERQMTIGKIENADTVKKSRADVADKQAQLKAISKALADTPENVVKKLKVLKKQKLDESKAKAQAEAKLLTIRKEKTKAEAELETQKELAQQGAGLVAQVRELYGLCEEANKKIGALSEDEADTLTITQLDEELLEGLEKILPETEAKDKDKDTKEAKGTKKAKEKVKKKAKKK